MTGAHPQKPRGVLVPVILIAALGLGWLLMGNDAPRQTVAWAALPMASVGKRSIIFNRDIRPILADRCFSCHGPDPNKRQADLRLDRPEAAMGPLKSDPSLHAFVPGDPDHSEAISRIFSTDPDEVMPPSTSHLKLDAKEKDLIRQWVAGGGPYQEHWAFTAPVRPRVPTVRNTAWPKNDIDRFVLANLEANRLAPSPQADKTTLIRRVSLDLTGIPPTPAEVDAFVKDASPNAYEKVVDRLLASPRYGEQMAVQWLDYARYADSHGYQSDPERHMWLWRDWVINAYNSNMPFDQFAIKQLAGDLLPNATVDDRIATGFNRNHRINDEGGIIPEEWRVEGVIDRVSTTSAVFMGLTLECCRCHDHKYDPITQKEFYSFSAYFNSVNEQGIGDTGSTDRGNNVPPILKVATPDQQKQLDALDSKIAGEKSKLAELTKDLPNQVAKLEQNGGTFSEPMGLLAKFPMDEKLAGEDGDGKLIPANLRSKGEPHFTAASSGNAVELDGKSAVDAGDLVHFDRTDSFSYGAWINRRGDGAIMSRMDAADAFRGFDLFIDENHLAVHIIHQWPDIAIKVRTVALLPKKKWVHVFATYDGSGHAAGVKIYFDGQAKPVQILNDSLTGTICTKSPVLIGSRDGGSPFTGDISDVRFYSRALLPSEIGIIAHGQHVAAILKTPADQRTPEQHKTLTAFVEATDPDLAKANASLSQLNSDKTALENTMPDTMVMEELPKPRDTFVLLRGAYDKHGDKVEPGVPAVLPHLPADAPPNRLGLARWIVDPANPLTARVQVNRLWEKFFGVGIVKTSENLGTQSEWPSNPELLDWLATEFVRLNWDTKAIQKEMVMSAAYQQTSEITPEMLERDPENRLISRGPRFRLSAEQIRDQALSISGLLVEKIGGPSARPYEPHDQWSASTIGNLTQYVQDKGDGLYRRSVYTFIKRTAAPANLSLFDQPSREYCIIRRSRTDTPLQALDLMNDDTYQEAARVLAEHVMQQVHGMPAQRIAEAFKRVTCREPSAKELSILSDGFEQDLARFKKDPASAAKIVTVGSAPPDKQLDACELAAYTMVTSTIFNLDESVTRQ
jgi:hypothetical protein